MPPAPPPLAAPGEEAYSALALVVLLRALPAFASASALHNEWTRRGATDARRRDETLGRAKASGLVVETSLDGAPLFCLGPFASMLA